MTFVDGDEFKVPDVVGAIVGWRTWDVGEPGGCSCGRCGALDHGQAWLSSRVEWPGGEPLQARHGRWIAALHGQGGPHHAPHPRCLCGIHAIKDPADLIGQPGSAATSNLRDGTSVAGQVALWGRVIPHERGWRAEYAKPLSIVPLWEGDEPEDVRAVRERYNLPLVECLEMVEAVRMSMAQYAKAFQVIAKGGA